MHLLNVLQNNLLITALSAWLAAQIIKTLIHFFYVGERNWSRLWGSGGMPSSHAATVSAMATAAGLNFGFDNYPFAIATVLALVVMYDACGVRRAAGEQARILNEWGEMLAAAKNLPMEERLKEFIGHTPFQVLMGALLGIVVAIIMHLI
ncbi:MAG: divergent PAP2 family protein [Oscillospiraceae bacterium]|nr:divergent PAP2 family protein [Oscillospiraceae bacterium]